MLAVVVELLTERYVATAYNDRNRAEWPPHPARLFSTLVATWAEGEPDSEEGSVERQALEWLEGRKAPEVLADPETDSGRRTVVPVFVPVNDASVVAEVDRSKLEEAERALSLAVTDKERARGRALVDKLNLKAIEDAARVASAPLKFGKDARLGARLLPEYRPRQERRFPCVSPAHPRFAFVWESEQPSPLVLDGLNNLLKRVVRMGHSSSMVHARLARTDDVDLLRKTLHVYQPEAARGELVLRWVGEGQVAALQQAFVRHLETDTRVLPARFVRYRSGMAEISADVPLSLFSNEFLIFERVGGPLLPITSCVGLAKQLRRALMSVADEPIHSMLSGHNADGTPSEGGHLAVVPLPLVTGPYPDGAIRGVALVLPRKCSTEGRRAVLKAVGELEQPTGDLIELKLSQAPPLKLRRLVGVESLKTLRSDAWCQPSCCWATVTPIALDRNPGDLHSADFQKRTDAFEKARGCVLEALARIGLPAPSELEVMRSCWIPGAAKPRSFPRYPSDTSRAQRVLVHACFYFATPVSGPLLVGAGRYHGLGLCLPIDRGGLR